jgi:uncharacterized protein YndB with AHSA1/START domain
VTVSRIARVQRVMPAPPDAVFDEWLDPASLVEWMCPRPARCVAVTVQPHVGGTMRFDVDTPDGTILITGQFLAIDRPSLLRFTWTNSDWADPTIQSVVTVTFEPAGDEQTVMTIEHRQLPAEHFDDFQSGWIDVCEQLHHYLRGHPVGG